MFAYPILRQTEELYNLLTGITGDLQVILRRSSP